jgi:hypothetical protein
MSTKYKVTISFEVTDEFDETKKEIEKNGLQFVESGIASGFCDPNFSNIVCKLEEVSNGEQ